MARHCESVDRKRAGQRTFIKAKDGGGGWAIQVRLFARLRLGVAGGGKRLLDPCGVFPAEVEAADLGG